MPNAIQKVTLRATKLTLCAMLLAACGGAEQGTGEIGRAECSPSSTILNPDTREVAISGLASFDSVPPYESAASQRNSAGSLNYDATETVPIKRAAVELLDRSNQVIATTTSDDNGRYTLVAPMDTALRVRVLAKVEHSNYAYSVVDNTEGDSLYALAGGLVNSSTCDSTRNLHAASGWDSATSAYSSTRAAAPFAILDAIFEAMALLTATDPEVRLPTLVLNWSPNNIAAAGEKPEGNIGTSHYDNQNKIFLLGHENNDTDEYDRSVIQHEFAHFLEDNLWRSDNIGGSHSLNGKLDIRLAFGEGFANAFASIVSGSEIYSDSFSAGQSTALVVNIESGSFGEIGWYSERSTGEIVYDLYDPTNDGEDTLSLGFGPLYDTLSSSSYTGNRALTSIYLLISELKTRLSTSEASAIDNLVRSHNIEVENAFGDGETNDGGDPDNLPLYHQLSVGETLNLCSNNLEGFYSGLGVRRFARFSIDSEQRIAITLRRTSGASSADPDGILFRPDGSQLNLNASFGSIETHSEVMQGEYILEVFNYGNISGTNSITDGGRACFDVTLESE